MDSIKSYGVPKLRELEKLADKFYTKGIYTPQEKREIEGKMNQLKEEICSWVNCF